MQPNQLPLEKNTIYPFDCLDSKKGMPSLPDECVDLVITSPPYNILNSTGGGFPRQSFKWQNAQLKNGYTKHSDNMPREKYIEWQRKCLTQMFRLIKNDGAIFYNHKWRVQRGLIEDASEIVKGFPIRQIIIWQRAGGINFNDSYFLPTYEVIYLICKPKFSLLPKANSIGDVWKISQARSNSHPAPFPIELPSRIIRSTKAKLILDPFIGSGSTALAALKYKRSYIGYEHSIEYVCQAERKIKRYLGKRTDKGSTSSFFRFLDEFI